MIIPLDLGEISLIPSISINKYFPFGYKILQTKYWEIKDIYTLTIANINN